MKLTLCDYCTNKIVSGITVSAGWGSIILDGELDFCNDECLMSYWNKEYTKAKVFRDRKLKKSSQNTG